VHVHENGVWLKFAEKLDPDWVTDLSKHFAQVWNYRYGPGYGSPEYSPSHPATPGHDPLRIESVRLLAGGDTLFVELPDLQPVNQLHLYLQTSPEAATQIFVTVNRMDRPFADFEGYVARRKEVLPHPIVQDVMLATRSIPNPWRQPIDGAREVRIECTSSLSYATPSFRAKPGEAIKLTLVNPDVVPHNWAIVAPGSLERIGNLTNRYIADPEAPLRHYVPDSPEVLAYTDIVLPKGEFSIHFRVPDKPGRYPYLCTFPGHWSVMNGEMVVEP
jgi:plastocyanin